MSKLRGILTAALVVVGLATSVVVAQAALPTISDVTVPPVARFGVACSGCHRAALSEPAITEPSASDVASSTVKTDGGNGADDPRNKGGHETVVPARAAANERSVDRSGKRTGEQARNDDDSSDSADRDKARDHETVGEHAHERDHEGGRERRDGDDERRGDDSSD